jgi:predicted aspartyl protease
MPDWKMKLLGAAMLVALLSPLVIAQDTPPPANGEDDNAEQPVNDGRTTVVPFRFDGLVFVDVTVNGQGPYEMLFDSGATQSVLNRRLAEELNLEQHDAGTAVQGVGAAEAKLAVVNSIAIGDFKRDKSLVAVMDFDHMSGSLGRHLWGIVGMNVIRYMENLTIDFSTHELHMTRYPAGEEPSNMMEEMLIEQLEGGGAGIPGLPGLPEPGELPFPRPERRPDRQPERERPREPQEEDFSMPGVPGAWKLANPAAGVPGADLMQDGRTSPRHRSPREGMTLTYTTGEITIPFVNFKMELSPYWHVEAVVNGKTRRFMFDTGASMLLVLDTKLANELNVPRSVSYPVKGIGTDSAYAGMVESFALGVVRTSDLAATVLDLPKVSQIIRDQLGPLGAFLPSLTGLDFDGILGITFATRFKSMSVDTRNRTMEFTPYKDDEINHYAPFESEEFVNEAAIRTWNSQAGTFDLEGDSVPLEDWAEHGLETGGLKITKVTPEGAADTAGLKVGDIITHLVGEAEFMPGHRPGAEEADEDLVVRDLTGLILWACNRDPGSLVQLQVKRGDEVITVAVTLGTLEWTDTIPERYRR